MRMPAVSLWRLWTFFVGMISTGLSGYFYFCLQYWFFHAPLRGHMTQIIFGIQAGQLLALCGFLLSAFGRGWPRIAFALVGAFEIWLWWGCCNFA
jgi:hypothetical protein